MNIAIGDHELENSKLPQYMEHFDLTDQYYSFDYQNVHFTVMADYVSDEIGSEQYDFVKDDLAKAAADPNIHWIIITHHSQKYASTKNYDIPEEKEWNNTNLEGQIYLTAGTGGVNLHKLNENKAPYIITAQDEEYGFLNVDVTAKQGGTTMLVGKFYSNDDGGSGEVTDQFTITKSE